MENIYLVGFMGTGKTAVAYELSKRLNRKFMDLDDLIVEREGCSINEIFAQSGETYFRKIEKDVVREVSKLDNLVVACGGGVVLDKENLENLKNNGVVICLSTRAEVILERTKEYSFRPLLNVKDPKAKIEELLKVREPFYAQADYCIDTSDLTIVQVIEKIIDILRQ